MIEKMTKPAKIDVAKFVKVTNIASLDSSFSPQVFRLSVHEKKGIRPFRSRSRNGTRPCISFEPKR